MIDIVNQAVQWLSTTVSVSYALGALITLYCGGVASRMLQYEMFCKQSFAEFRSDVMIDQCAANKLSPTKIAPLLVTVDDFVSKFMRRAASLAILWPILVPADFVLSYFTNNPRGEAEMAMWHSGLSMLELYWASRIRFEWMDHNNALLESIIKLTLVCAPMGDTLQQKYLKSTRADEESEDEED